MFSLNNLISIAPSELQKCIENKKNLLILLFCFFKFLVFAQSRIPSNWDTKNPVDTEEYCYAVGFSEPCDSERQASSQAWRQILSYFANSISTFVTVNTDTFVTSEGYESDVLDAYTLSIEHSSWKSEVPLFGVKIIDKKIEKSSEGIVIKLLGCMSRKDFEKSRIAVQNEETAELAYTFYKSKNIPDFSYKNDETYTKWLKSKCAIFEFSDKLNNEQTSAAFEKFLTKLYRNISIYKCIFDNHSTFVVYNHNDYLNKIISALQKTDCFLIEHDGNSVILSWKNKTSLSDFISYCENMKDSRMIALFGVETFYLPSGAIFKNTENRTVIKFKDILQKNYKLNTENTSLSFESYDDMKTYVKNHKKDFYARYYIFCTTETQCEEFDRKSWVNANISFVLLDIETGEEYSSEVASSMPMSAVITLLSDEQVKIKSKIAIDNACNPDKNPESILLIIQDIFNQLP